MRWRRAALLACASALVFAGASSGAPTPEHVHFTAAGDYASDMGSTAGVLNALSADGSDIHLALGDLSFATTGQEDVCCDFVKSRVGASFRSSWSRATTRATVQRQHQPLLGVPAQPGARTLRHLRRHGTSTCRSRTLWSASSCSRRTWTSPTARRPTRPDRPATTGPRTPSTVPDPRASRGWSWACTRRASPWRLSVRHRCPPDETARCARRSTWCSMATSTCTSARQLSLGTGCASFTIGTFNANCVVDSDSDLSGSRHGLRHDRHRRHRAP